MSLYKNFKTDPEIEKKGIWIEFGQNSEGKTIRILIARAGGANEQFFKRSDVVTKPFRRQIQNETIDRQTVTRLNQEVFAETVVLGWENMEDENDQPLVFNKQNCLKVFKDLPDVWSDVFAEAQRAANYRAEIREEDAKN